MVFFHLIRILRKAHWVNSRISCNSRENQPKIGRFGPLYIRSKQRSEIELIFDNHLVIYDKN